VYGLGARRNAIAVQRVFALKQRPRSHPLIVHLADAGALALGAADHPGCAAAGGALLAGLADAGAAARRRRAGRGHRRTGHGRAARAGASGGAAPAGGVRRWHRRAVGQPLRARRPTRARHVRDEFGASLRWLLDGGACDVGLESTIVDCGGPVPRLLRPGSITLAQLRAVVPQVEAGAALDLAARARFSMPRTTRRATALAIVADDALRTVSRVRPRPGGTARSWHSAGLRGPRGPRTGTLRGVDRRGQCGPLATTCMRILRELDNAGAARILVQARRPARRGTRDARSPATRGRSGRDRELSDAPGPGALP
jgi:L-threonylcarbamoyladenylate synthase